MSNTTDAEDINKQLVYCLLIVMVLLWVLVVGYNESNGNTLVAWNWKAGGTASSNTDGSITSSVSVNTTSGFSVITFTGDGNADATVGHGLGVAPKMVIVKSRSAATAWFVYHASLTTGDNIYLNDTGAPFGGSYVF
jgi:hypothetical protein